MVFKHSRTLIAASAMVAMSAMSGFAQDNNSAAAGDPYASSKAVAGPKETLSDPTVQAILLLSLMVLGLAASSD